MPELIDWQVAVLLLRRRSRRSLESHARSIGMDGGHLRRLARGETREPRFGTGVRLLDRCHDYFSDQDWSRVSMRVEGAAGPGGSRPTATTAHNGGAQWR